MANASLINSGSGSIVVAANADASGQTSAFARAVIYDGISQFAYASGTGGAASVTMTNIGSIAVDANAVAFAGHDGVATAQAGIETAIRQAAYGSASANVALNNSGTIAVHAAASASGDEGGFARADIQNVIDQYASSATGATGNATVSLTNTGSITAGVVAKAVGAGDVSASAYDYGILQRAFGGTSGTASVSLVNNKLLSITADANALGGGDGKAFAFAAGIGQSAAAGSGAMASVTNTANIIVAATADVTVGNAAHRGASAIAVAGASGIHQHAAASKTATAFATHFTGAFTGTTAVASHTRHADYTATTTFTSTPSELATVSFQNTGSLSVLSVAAHASAVADNVALAYAFANGVHQHAQGSSAVANVVNEGTIAVDASAVAHGKNGASAIAFASGVHQAATAAAFHSVAMFHGTAKLHYTGAGATAGTAVEPSFQLRNPDPHDHAGRRCKRFVGQHRNDRRCGARECDRYAGRSGSRRDFDNAGLCFGVRHRRLAVRQGIVRFGDGQQQQRHHRCHG